MTKKLGDADRRAVDLVLDRSLPDNAGGFVQPNVSPHRVRSVEKILSLLHYLPVEEPPADLVSRTLRRVNAAPAIDPPDAEGPSPMAGQRQLS
ncbi:MAG: hypothetical protein ABR964_11445 [Tepidisphaeraceae bacterium]|jgi:hypothetical protein